MPAVTVRGLALLPPGETTPKNFRILVPVMANDLTNAAAAAAAGDIVELRLDALPAVGQAAVLDALRTVRAAIGDTPLLATFRTAREGGLAALTGAEYAALCETVCRSGYADLIDVEFSTGPEVYARVQAAARQAGVKTVFSSHDFAKTPDTEAMAASLRAMAAAGADIAKLAVMPASPADTARLLQATALAAGQTPLITMAMGAAGAVSRVCGAAFGCCAGFAVAGVSSAPGQPDAAALRKALDALGDTLA